MAWDRGRREEAEKAAEARKREAEAEKEAAAAAEKEAAAAAAEAAANALSPEELTALEASIAEQGEAVRAAKAGGDDDAVGAAVATLLELKGRLPAGHPLLQKPKKKKKAKK